MLFAGGTKNLFPKSGVSSKKSFGLHLPNACKCLALVATPKTTSSRECSVMPVSCEFLKDQLKALASHLGRYYLLKPEKIFEFFEQQFGKEKSTQAQCLLEKFHSSIKIFGHDKNFLGVTRKQPDTSKKSLRLQNDGITRFTLKLNYVI
jgi:hypothetical protein